MEARPWERNRRTRSFPLCPTPGCRTGLVYSLVIMEVGPFSLLCLLFHSIPWLCFLRGCDEEMAATVAQR